MYNKTDETALAFSISTDYGLDREEKVALLRSVADEIERRELTHVNEILVRETLDELGVRSVATVYYVAEI